MRRETQNSPQGQQIGVKYKNFAQKNASEQMRIVRGYAIISKGDTPKETAQKEPEFMITDGCHSYKRSIVKEMPTTNHVQLKTIRSHINNNPIERINGSIRDRIKTMRGLQNLESADLMLTAHRNYYNFIRIHQTIGETPAEASNINIGLNSTNNRWLKLLELSLKGGKNE